MARTLTAALLLLTLAACTTRQPLPDAQPATLREHLQPGDRVELQRTDGTRLKLKVDEVTDEFLVGSDGKRTHRLLLNTIRSIDVRRMTTQDKWLTAAGIAVAIGAIVVIADDGGGGGGEGGGGGGGY